MEMKEYLEKSKATDLADYNPPLARVNDEVIRLLHGAIGISTEANEILDMVKKHVYYGKPLDKVNTVEEIGDVLWYCALLLRLLEFDFETTASINIAKLKERFPEKFNEVKAIARNIGNERVLMEKLIATARREGKA